MLLLKVLRTTTTTTTTEGNITPVAMDVSHFLFYDNPSRKLFLYGKQFLAVRCLQSSFLYPSNSRNNLSVGYHL